MLPEPIAPPPPLPPEKLIAAALRVFTKNGPLRTRLEDIRKEAGMSVGAVYHHVADKEALAGAVYADALGRYQRGLVEALREHPDAERGVKAGVRHHLHWCAAHPDEARFLLQGRALADEERLAALNRSFFADIKAWWGPHVHYGALRDLDVLLLDALWMGPAQEYMRHFLAGDARQVPAAAADELAEAAWKALRV